MRYILLFFVVVPLVELYLLVWLSSQIGFGTTVAITLVTGIVGGSLAKRQGLQFWRAWNQALAEMRTPEEGIVDGLLVVVGGTLLITPGVMTDIVGLLLLVTPVRRAVADRVRAALNRRITRQTTFVATGNGFGPAVGHSGTPRVVIETTGETKPEP